MRNNIVSACVTVFLLFLISNISCGKLSNDFLRIKRDDGSFLTNSGGPVAGNGKNQTTKHDKSASSESKSQMANCQEVSRSKRDDGSFLSNSAGPVAGNSQNKSQHSDNSVTDSSVTNSADDVNFLCDVDNLVTQLPLRKNAKTIDIEPSQKQHLVSAISGLPIRKNARKRILRKKHRSKVQLDFVSKQGFGGFMDKFGKKYDQSELTKRQNILSKNLDFISKLNSNRKSPLSAGFGLTKFSDLNFAEFKQKLAGSLLWPTIKIKGTKETKDKIAKCPVVDWVSYGIVPKVREQIECGSCYALTSADLLASQSMIDNKSWNQTFMLSSQYILDCFQDPAALGCKGGRPKKVFDKLSSCPDCKVPLESCYTYQDKQGECKPRVTCSDAPDIKVKHSELMDMEGSEEKEIMASLLQWGPVVAIVGLADVWQFYNGTGIITADQCKEKGNHAVLITGYDYTQEIPHYIIKNSWGSDWGDKGFVRVEAGKNACDVAKSVTVLCTKDCDTKTTVESIMKITKYPKCSTG